MRASPLSLAFGPIYFEAAFWLWGRSVFLPAGNTIRDKMLTVSGYTETQQACSTSIPTLFTSAGVFYLEGSQRQSLYQRCGLHASSSESPAGSMVPLPACVLVYICRSLKHVSAGFERFEMASRRIPEGLCASGSADLLGQIK